jgi:hypothetical protein
MDNIQITFTPVQVKINNDDTLLHIIGEFFKKNHYRIKSLP